MMEAASFFLNKSFLHFCGSTVGGLVQSRSPCHCSSEETASVVNLISFLGFYNLYPNLMSGGAIGI